jgi:hypothetical protein
MFYWKPTKLKVFFSSIPLVLFVIADIIAYGGLLIFGTSNLAFLNISVYFTKYLPFLFTIRSFYNKLLGIDLDSYFYHMTFMTEIKVLFADALIVMTYFFSIYLIYSFVQRWYLDSKQS